MQADRHPTVMFVFVGAALLGLLLDPAAARPRHGGSQPIIAGQPDVRVSPSGNVVGPARHLRGRDTNGKVRLRSHRFGHHRSRF